MTGMHLLCTSSIAFLCGVLVVSGAGKHLSSVGYKWWCSDDRMTVLGEQAVLSAVTVPSLTYIV